MPLISIIIPCFNAGRWMQEALQSAVEQKAGDIEIIVVDDGSTDNSAEIVERDFPAARLIKRQRQGASRARGLGTKESKGEFIQYFDADDRLAPGKLKLQIESLKSSGADISYGNWQKLVKNKDGKFVKGETVERVLRNPEIELFTDFWCPPAVYLFRRSIVEKVGAWNKNLPIIQDARFVLDCALHKARFVYCPEIMAYYRCHSSGSLSSRDSIAFNRDVLTNAIEVEGWWRAHGGINDKRKRALLQVYGYTARASFERDRTVFELAYRRLEELSPGYIPEKPRHLRLASRFMGYRNAESAALCYRRLKKILRPR